MYAKKKKKDSSLLFSKILIAFQLNEVYQNNPTTLFFLFRTSSNQKTVILYEKHQLFLPNFRADVSIF